MFVSSHVYIIYIEKKKKDLENKSILLPVYLFANNRILEKE